MRLFSSSQDADDPKSLTTVHRRQQSSADSGQFSVDTAPLLSVLPAGGAMEVEVGATLERASKPLEHRD